MDIDISPIQVEGIRITKFTVVNEPYGAGRTTRSIEKTRVFVNIKDETVIQNLRSRMAQRAGAPRRLSPRDMRKHILKAVVERLKTEHPKTGITDPKQLRWSAKAGCTMCPCSPGFVVENSYNYRIDVEVEPASTESTH